MKQGQSQNNTLALDIELNLSDKNLVHSEQLTQQTLKVYQNNQFTWFTLGGNAVQSVMSVQAPHLPLLPVTQAMLLPALISQANLNILNLGLGGGTIERALLASNEQHKITSVEHSASVINVCQQYFQLADAINIVQDDAYHFISQNKQAFDVVLADLFSQQQLPAYYYHHSFFNALSVNTNDQGSCLINLYVEDEQQLSEILIASKADFPHAALFTFTHYKNLVLWLSKSAIDLPSNAASLVPRQFQQIDFQPHIDQLRVIPMGIKN